MFHSLYEGLKNMRNLEKHRALEMALSHLHAITLECGDVRNDIVTLIRRVKHEGMAFLTKALAQLGKAFDACLGGGIFTWDFGKFKKCPKSSFVPEFLRSLFLKVIGADGRLLAEPCIMTVRFLRTFLFLLYKVELEVEYDDADIMAKFCANDDDVIIGDSLSFPALQNRMAQSLGEVFDDFDFNELEPSHGPGVSSNLSRKAKYSYYPPNSPVVSKFGRSFFNHPLERYPFGEIGQLEGSVQCFANFMISFFGNLSESDAVEKPIAKMLLVPKDSRGPRVISCEPVEHMYAQQSLKDYMVHAIENHPLTKGRVNFTDQTVNRELVSRHSVDKAYSTLDLKDASDMVPYGIVKDIFPREMFEYMDACRSEATESPTGGTIRVLNKWAPMGSALCFPVMAIYLYLGIIHYVSIATRTPTSQLKPIYVYGDDIVCPTEYAQMAIRAIEILGLKVNEDKSFIDSNFLESCGMDSLFGNEVTPFRLKKLVDNSVKTSGREIDNPDFLVHIVAIANLAHETYPALAEYLYTLAEKKLGPLPYGIETTPFLCRVCYSSEIAWDLNRIDSHFTSIKGEIPQKIRGWSQVTVGEEYADSSYGKLRKSLKRIGVEKPKPLEWVPSRATKLRRKKYQEWYDTAYA